MPRNTRMTIISRITTDGEDAGSRDFAIKSGDMSQQVQSTCPHDGSDIVDTLQTVPLRTKSFLKLEVWPTSVIHRSHFGAVQ